MCFMILLVTILVKYVVHLEMLLRFHHRPLFDDESGSFSTPPPPAPIHCCFKGGTLSAHSMGEGERNGDIVKKRPSAP